MIFLGTFLKKEKYLCSLTLGRRCCVTESVGFTISIELASATSFHFEVLAGKIVGATGGGGITSSNSGQARMK